MLLSKSGMIKLVVMLIIIGVLGFFAFYEIDKRSSKVDTNETSGVKFARVSDNFDFENMSFSDAARNPEISKQFIKIYNALASEDSFTYIEHGIQHVSFKGYYDKSEDFVYGSNSSRSMNQKIKTGDSFEYNTPIKAIQIGMSTSQYFELDDKIENGRGFDEQDFLVDEGRISLILGHKYKDVYELGDNIEFYYLFTKFDGKVIGFLDESALIPIDNTGRNLDTYIVMPYFYNCESVKTEFDIFEEVHISERSLGLIPYATQEEFEQYRAIVAGIALEFDLPYILVDY